MPGLPGRENVVNPIASTVLLVSAVAVLPVAAGMWAATGKSARERFGRICLAAVALLAILAAAKPYLP